MPNLKDVLQKWKKQYKLILKNPSEDENERWHIMNYCMEVFFFNFWSCMELEDENMKECNTASCLKSWMHVKWKRSALSSN